MTHAVCSFYEISHEIIGVEAILDTSGNVVVKYLYNAWGELISTTGSLASSVGLSIGTSNGMFCGYDYYWSIK